MSQEEGQVRWLPLESNPDVLNNYITNMGVEQGVFSFQDVLSTDDWATDMVSLADGDSRAEEQLNLTNLDGVGVSFFSANTFDLCPCLI